MSNITRRAAITGTAAVAVAAGAPALADNPASLPLLAADHPDAAIFEAWEQYQSLALLRPEIHALEGRIPDRDYDAAANAHYDRERMAIFNVVETDASTFDGLSVKLRAAGELYRIGKGHALGQGEYENAFDHYGLPSLQASVEAMGGRFHV